MLTPGQAAHLAAELLMAASTIGLGRRTDITVAPPRITSNGDLHVVSVDDPSEGISVDDLLTDLVDHARNLPAHPRPRQLALLRRLEDVVGTSHEPAARALMLREALDEAIGPDADTRIARELAALVTAFSELKDAHVDATTPIPLPTTAPALPGPRRALGRRRTRPLRRWIAIAVPVCVLAVVGGYLAYGRLGQGPGADPAAHHAHAGTPTGAKHHHAPAHPHATVPVIAPHQAGRITGVDLQRLNSCAPGALCGVRVTVAFTPAALTQMIGWRVGVVQPCTQHVTWSTVTSVAAQPGWTKVYAPSSVKIPPGHPFALVAVTSTPAHAQSNPAMLTSSVPRC